MSHLNLNPRGLADHLRDEVNRFDEAHPEWREETEGLRTATARAIGFLEAFAEVAEVRAALEGRDG